MANLKSGLLAPKTDPRIKSVSRYMRPSNAVSGAALNPPASADWSSQITAWPIYGNTTLNDCVPAAFGHAVLQQTQYSGKPFVPTEGDVEAFYAAACEPPKWTQGSSDAGTGCVMVNALATWLSTGIGGHKPTGYAWVNHRDEAELQKAIAVFGNVICGLALPQSAIAQWDNMQPWDITSVGNSSWGSWCIHGVLIVKYDSATGLYDVVSWGRIQQMTFNFMQWYMTESYVIASRDFIMANGKSPSHLNLGALTVDMMDPMERQIHALYVAMYGRAADDFGVKFWLSALKSRDPGYNNTYVYADISTDDQMWLAQQFYNTQSAYFDAKYGTLDDTAFIEHLYMNIGGNMGDANGISYWLSKMSGSSSNARAALAGQFAHDFLAIDLSAPGALSPEDYAAACARQQQFQNRVAVSKYWTQQSHLPNAGVLTVNSTSDRSFTAAQRVVAVVTADPATLLATEDAISAAVAANDLAPIFST